jgi:hypothetical protein
MQQYFIVDERVSNQTGRPTVRCHSNQEDKSDRLKYVFVRLSKYQWSETNVMYFYLIY